eukprot:CAMPEP_0201144748 /NCGR_PEP_ID=MMETSP0851-20130426/6494_1 /ASSEMBLY_ACC=CAM_ASM_000631 /TAXON_ID=183588 /ORGANISM="Pseudo-nitzschia fraudulenta, Strain WWA7" /LENGTH=595 /DNA_ID=CAMNT_0047419639 /DNA_START=240 /DNA_END=2023 /DNA_ORIENTATION=-
MDNDDTIHTERRVVAATKNHKTSDGGDGVVIGLIDFPRGGTLGLDGQSIVLKTDDFVGVRNVPPETFHLVTFKNGNKSNKSNNNNNNNRSETNNIDTAVAVGFVVFGGGSTHRHEQQRQQHLIRRYDPLTEEVASEERSPVDAVTKQNLVRRVASGVLPPTRVLSYDQIVSGSGNDCDNNDDDDDGERTSPQSVWREQSRYILPGLLGNIRGLSPGDKIVPGCYDPEDVDGAEQTQSNNNNNNEDGRSMVYPPIPVVDRNLSLATHRHNGTNRFLSKLSPGERTRLFLLSSSQPNNEEEDTKDAASFVWLDKVLEDCYQNSWEALLGDLQLSYLLFLHLGCYSSLEHWKDLLAMLSLAVAAAGPSPNGRKRGRTLCDDNNNRHDALYRGLLRLLPYQLSSMKDPEFLEIVEEGGGNFLVPSLERLREHFAEGLCAPRLPHQQPPPPSLLRSVSRFEHVLSARFPRTFGSPAIGAARGALRPTTTGGVAGMRSNGNGSGGEDNHHADTGNRMDDDDDGPVVVSPEEIEASLARSSGRGAATARGPRSGGETEAHHGFREGYPLLAAAMAPFEDVPMLCARVLDERKDVSLVREAAA